MRVLIEVNCENSAFEADLAGELKRILATVPLKVYEQLEHGVGCLCEAPERADKLFDINGNTVGFVRVED